MKLLNLIISITFLSLSLLKSAAAEWKFPTTSPLSSGRWVKVKVDSTGVQRITHDRLRSWGFSNPSKVAVYGFGSVEMSLKLKANPVDLPSVPVAHYGDALYFYGEGETRYTMPTAKSVDVYTNRYSNGSYYFLTDDAEPTPMPLSTEVVADHDMTPALTHRSLAMHYPRELNPSDGGAYWYSRNITATNPYQVAFALTDFVSDGLMGYKAIGKQSDEPTMTPAITANEGVTFTHNGGDYPIYRSTNDKEVYRNMQDANVSEFTPASGVDKVIFTVKPDENLYVPLLCVEYMWTVYSRKNVMPADGSPLTMYFPSHESGEVSLGNADESDIVVWNVTDVHNPVSLTVESYPSGGVIFGLKSAESGSSKIEAFSPSSKLIAEPEYAGEVPNTDLHAISGGYDMLIISSPDFLQAAHRLAQAHAEYQGLNVLVASKEDVLNEFGSGSFTPNALRIFAKMLHDRDRRLRYLLLMGDAYYDNRKVASATGPYMPSYQAELQTNAYNVAKAYTADSFFGFVEDNIEPDMCTRVDNITPRVIDIAVGRFPVFTAHEADVLVDKAIAYLRDPSKAGDPGLMMFMADRGNENQHVAAAEAMRTELHKANPGMTALRLYDASYRKYSDQKINTTLLKHIKAGFASNPSLMMYCGHGSAVTLYSDVLIDRSFFESVEYGSASLFYSASCHPYTFDHDYRGLVSDALFLPEGGATCIIGPAREVFLKNNIEMTIELGRQYYNPQHTTIGDVYRAAMTNLQEQSMTIRTNSLSFNLGGDPALPLPRITGGVTVDKADDEKMVFTQGAKKKLSGTVTRADGSLWSDFDGTLEIKVYDTPLQFTSYVNVSADATDRVALTLDETVIAVASCEVKQGKWETYITVPPVASAGGSNRVTFLARQPGSFAMASGFTTDATLAPYDAAVATPDNDAPLISIVLSDALAGADRVETSRSPRVTITIDDGDGTGVNMNEGGVGCMPSVIIDGNKTIEGIGRMFKPCSSGGYELSYTPSEFKDGRHTITVNASDNAGNPASATVEFFVVEQAFNCSLAMENDVVEKEAGFTLVHPLSRVPQSRIVVEDMQGRHVMSREFSGDMFTWNLKDERGVDVPAGSYKAYAVVKSHPRYSSTEKLKFTVIR